MAERLHDYEEAVKNSAAEPYAKCLHNPVKTRQFAEYSLQLVFRQFAF